MSQSTKNSQRAYQLLGNLRKVFNHDLPNQVVVIHGLLQLLKLDEKSSLTSEAREYLQRSEGACKRVLQMLDTLKKIVDMDSLSAQKETVVLADLLRELGAAARQTLNGAGIDSSPASIKTLLAPRALLQQALLNLLTAVAPKSSGARIRMAVEVGANGVDFCLGQTESRSAAQPLSLDALKGVENRLALLYVQELADSWGGSVKTNADATCFVLSVPQ